MIRHANEPLTNSRLVDIAIFNSAKDNTPKLKRMPWEEFCVNYMANPTIVRLGKSREEAKKSLRAFSLVTYLPGTKRGTKNVQSVDALVLDIDQAKGRPDLTPFLMDECAGILAAHNAESWLYSTFSSTPECPKFRVVIPTAAPVQPGDWPRYVDAALAHLDLDSPRIIAALDLKATKDVARLWFLPAVWEEQP